MADRVGQQPGKHHPMHVLGEGNVAVALEGASRAESSGQTLPVLPSEHATQDVKIPEDALPTGTVTLLFTDIEGSTQLLQHLGDRYALVLTTCRNLLRAAFQQWNGCEIDTQGDAFFVAFARATDAVSAVVAAQRSLAAYPWPEGAKVRMRMGLHTSEPTRSSEGYIGLDVHFVARLTRAAHGGQVLLSETTKELAEGDLPDGVILRDVGAYHLEDFPGPRRIFQLVMADLPADFPPLRNLFIQFNNLPAQLTSLIGREQEETAVCTLLRREDVRLLTLTGTGGIGKTRLSLAVATEVLDTFVDGICFVPLAPISDPALVVLTIAHLLGLEHQQVRQRTTSEHMDFLKAFLRDKHFLLLLDNFEQVVSAAPYVVDLVTACPHLKMLVTSRAALHIHGEQEFPVPPLALPKRTHLPSVEEIAQYAAVALFVQRAQAAKPNFVLTKTNTHAIAAICLHLDGLPLAIELAAARIKLLPPQPLLQRLTHRLPMLTGGARNAPERQQTLRNTLAWSYNLLDAEEQCLFRRLSVFMGGCTLEAIESLCAAFADGTEQVLDGVASLIDKSLLQQTELEGEEPRLVMLETIREFGLECLTSSGEMEQTRHAHAQYYLHLAEESEAQLFSAEQERWFDQLEREHDNLRAALEWAVHQGEAGQRIELALRLGGALAEFWSVRGYINEGRPWLERALASSLGATVSVRAKALKNAGWLAVMQDDGSQAEKLYEESLRLYQEVGETQGMAWSLFWLGWLKNDYALLEESRVLSRSVGDKVTFAHAGVALGSMAFDQGDYTMARSLFEESVALFEEMGNKEDMAWALRNLGRVLFAQGDEARAYALAEESLALCRELHDKISSAYTLDLLGRFALSLGKVTTARSLLEEGLALFRELGTQRHVAQVLSHVASVAAMQGDDTAAHALYEESLVLFRCVGDTRGLACCLQGWGAMIARQGELTWAARLWGAAETLSTVSGPQRFSLPVEHTDYERTDYERIVSTVRTQLGEQAFAKALAEGRTMTPEQALAKQGPETAHELAISAQQPARAAVPTPAYPNGLTAREVQVLCLVAKGLTNNEIGEELRLSEKTIAHHLTHIFNKTTSENRAAATAFAIRHGLA